MLIEIKNWEKYNPRKELKTLTWLRLDADIGFSESLFGLDPDARWLWIFTLSLSAKKNSASFLVDIDYVSFHSGVKKDFIEKYLVLFEQRGLIEIKSNSSRICTDAIENVSYERYVRNGTNDTYGTNDTQVSCSDSENSKPEDLDFSKISDIFNETLAGHGKVKAAPFFCPREVLEKLIILKGFPGFQTRDQWKTYFNQVKASNFLMGMSKKSFVITLAWLLDPENAFKIISGGYPNGEGEEVVTVQPPSRKETITHADCKLCDNSGRAVMIEKKSACEFAFRCVCTRGKEQLGLPEQYAGMEETYTHFKSWSVGNFDRKNTVQNHRASVAI